MFRRARVGTTGMSAAVTSNPHNQVLLIAIELGLVGVAVLLAMWAAHGLLFWNAGRAPAQESDGGIDPQRTARNLAAWLGLGIVVQNVVSALFNAQLFYFTPGWTYMFGVGVLGGMVLAPRRQSTSTAAWGAPRDGGCRA